jgi:hypothetical protein
MHPIVAQDLARSRIADFHRAADADRRVHAARNDDSEDSSKVHSGSRWGDAADPTGLVRRLLGRLRPAVNP